MSTLNVRLSWTKVSIWVQHNKSIRLNGKLRARRTHFECADSIFLKSNLDLSLQVSFIQQVDTRNTFGTRTFSEFSCLRQLGWIDSVMNAGTPRSNISTNNGSQPSERRLYFLPHYFKHAPRSTNQKCRWILYFWLVSEWYVAIFTKWRRARDSQVPARSQKERQFRSNGKKFVYGLR